MQPLSPHEKDAAFAEGEVRMLLVEPCGVRNTGDQGGERTAVNDLWI